MGADLSEPVRQALERIWHAERVCLAKKRAVEALEAERESWRGRVQTAKEAWELADKERERASDRLYALVLQAEKDEAA